MSRFLLRLDKSLQGLLDELTASAVAVAERLGAQGPTLRSEMETELKEVLRRDLVVSDLCGLSALCEEAEFFEPFSEAAEQLERQEE